MTNKVKHDGNEPHLLREIIRTYQLLLSNFSRATGMPASRFTLMRLLAFSEKELGVNEIARQLEINSAAVSRQVKELEQEKLVTKKPDKKDGRRSTIELSSEGWTLFADVHKRSHELEEILSKELGHEEIQITVKVLSKLRKFVEQFR